ncbi:hypothetical protein GCM10018954_020180 [Kutzneria kofuensis]
MRDAADGDRERRVRHGRSGQVRHFQRAHTQSLHPGRAGTVYRDYRTITEVDRPTGITGDDQSRGDSVGMALRQRMREDVKGCSISASQDSLRVNSGPKAGDSGTSISRSDSPSVTGSHHPPYFVPAYPPFAHQPSHDRVKAFHSV